jgi:hypothetical protein
VSEQPVAAAKADDLVVALARASVERAAPEELPLFAATSEAYLADPSALDGGKQKEDVLGFGVDAAMVLVTPVALQVARAVVAMVTEKLKERAKEEGEGVLDRLLDRVLKPDEEKPAAEPVAELTDEQLEQVRAVALEKARALRLSDEKATLLADSLVGTLATA